MLHMHFDRPKDEGLLENRLTEGLRCAPPIRVDARMRYATSVVTLSSKACLNSIKCSVHPACTRTIAEQSRTCSGKPLVPWLEDSNLSLYPTIALHFMCYARVSPKLYY